MVLEDDDILGSAVVLEDAAVPGNVEISPGHWGEERREERTVVDPQFSFVTTH